MYTQWKFWPPEVEGKSMLELRPLVCRHGDQWKIRDFCAQHGLDPLGGKRFEDTYGNLMYIEFPVISSWIPDPSFRQIQPSPRWEELPVHLL